MKEGPGPADEHMEEVSEEQKGEADSGHEALKAKQPDTMTATDRAQAAGQVMESGEELPEQLEQEVVGDLEAHLAKHDVVRDAIKAAQPELGESPAL